MYEDFGTIINKGFYSWVRNLKICIPFVLSSLVTVILYILFFGMIGFLVFGSNPGSIADPSALSETELISMVWKGLTENVLLSATLILMFILFVIFAESFFMAGAIGMAKKASETGDTALSDMIVSGSKNVFRLFLTILLITLLTLAGLVFIVPGALTVGNLSVLMENPESSIQGIGLLAIGVILWSIYVIVLSVVFSLTPYALVIDELEPLEAFRAGFRFFMENKVDVFFIWIISIGLAYINVFIGDLYGANSILVSGLTSLLSIVVLQPLITVLYTRLYASRKGRKLYDPADLLSCPDRF